MTAPGRPAARAKARRAPTVLPGQLDLFGALDQRATAEAPAKRAPIKTAQKLAPKPIQQPRTRPGEGPATATVPVPPPPEPKPGSPSLDEWWTTRIVCAFLKISRKTLWERRRNKDLGFPSPLHLGSARNLYRASAVRAWAERMAADGRTA